MAKQSRRSKIERTIVFIAALTCSLASLELGTLSNFGVKPLAAFATRLSPDVVKITEREFDHSKIRLDGSIETAGNQLYLPLLPAGTTGKKKDNSKAEIESKFPPDSKTPDVIFYSNGWAHIRLLRKGEAATLALPVDLPEKFRHKLESLRFPYDLIVPTGFVVPKSCKGLIQEVSSIALLDDRSIYSADFGQKKKAPAKETYKGSGTVFLTSITAGSITMLDGKTLNKVAEFPTEGTPCSMDLTNGLIYVADQGKSRVLIVDPSARKFQGQVDLPPRSAPKGIASLPNGKWLYVSESATGTVACIETATGKTLVKTKTHPGPGRMAITPDGTFLVVLNVTSGEVSIIATYNQQVVSVFKVGDMPTCVVISPDGKFAYVSNRLSNTVSVIDIPGHHVSSTIKTAQYPTGLALSPDGAKLYVSSARENLVTAYDTKNFAKLQEGHTPQDVEFPGYLCMMPDGKRLLLCSQQSDALAVMNTEDMNFEKSLTLGHPVHEAFWAPVP